MSAPTGVKSARWNQAVSAIVNALGITTAEADAWLNQVWLTMFEGDEVAGMIDAHARLRMFLEANRPDAPTLPRALVLWLTA